jgi:hypothetical protein
MLTLVPHTRTEHYSWVSVQISLTVYGSFYSVCLGALPNMVSSELLPTRARGAAMSALMGINSIANVLVVSAFPALQGRFGTSTTLLMCSVPPNERPICVRL